MGRPQIQVWTWTLCVFLSWMCVGPVLARPHYMVAVPAVIEAGAEAKFCVSLLQPNETVVMTVTLMSDQKNTTLLKQIASQEFHTCTQFQAPLVRNRKVQKLEVEVRGDTFYSKEVRKVQIKVYKPITFVQTDKPLYLPGQTVHFRVVTLDSSFRAVSQQYDVIELKDSNRNRIGQWLGENSNGKILQLSYSLNSEAGEGIYHIVASADGQKTSHSFKVEKYVLPKFDVKIKVPEEINVGQGEFKAEVCLRYTYGQPVPGTVEVKVCRHLNRWDRERTPHCFPPVTQQTDQTGCATFTLNTSMFTNLRPEMASYRWDVTATAEEEGTGVSFSQFKTTSLSYQIGTLSFIDTPSSYYNRSNIEGKVKAVDYNKEPLPDMVLYIYEGRYRHSARVVQTVTTDRDGIAAFSLSTANRNDYIFLEVKNIQTTYYPDHKKPHYWYRGHSVCPDCKYSPVPPVSSLTVNRKDKALGCGREEQISISYTVVGKKQGSVDVTYLVLSRGAIIMQGFKKVEFQDNSVTRGTLTFPLEVSAETAPVIQVVTYAVLPNEELIATSKNFKTEKCFSNKVSLEFSPSSAVPGEETTMQLTTQPNSLCGVSAVDQSVLILEPGKTLNADRIFGLLPVRTAPAVSEELLDVEEECYYMGVEDGPYMVFKNLGLKMATDLLIKLPECHLWANADFGSGGGGGGNPLKTIRSFFPETWIWDLVDVGESGTKDVSFTVPDTITTWETEAFCLSPQGFGLAPRKQITVFQPFFLELTLPYSIIRGEHFELKATVFNYLSSCIMVTVTPEPSLDYTLTPLSGDQYTSCLCGNERKTLRWTMVPSSLGAVNVTVSAEAVASQALCNNEVVSVPDRGRIDVVTRSLIVKAEGTEMIETHNWMLCPKGEALTEEVDLELPENVIVGSARASLSVLGDILGRALQNLDGLLRMPYGCGEQNMALLAPNIYILQYLINTQQLNPAILEKATNFLSSGYQRQLNYKHSDGSYSAFGKGEGNTWLTAFVMRCFAKAQSFTYIDPEKIQQSKTWLLSKQQTNGCFQKSGKLFNNRMKGGVSDEVTLSAYITASFLEMNMSVNEDVMRKSLSCLKESIGDLSNTYTTALLAYVFTLAGDMETRGQLLQHLDTVAVKQGGLLHWSQTAGGTSASLSVEISSYVMLAKLSASPSTEDLGYASGIVRWLTGQQNHYGGFSSTQDTVVALQALALYSTLVFSPEGSVVVTVQSPSGQLTFNVNHNNKLLYQEKALPDVTGKYSLEVKGTACASMQISLHYNIPTPTDVTTLSIEVKPEAVCSSRSQRPKLTLNFKSLYSGVETTTNMVILDIKMLSGFTPDPESLKRLQGASMVDRVEQKQDHVMVYLRELPKDIAINHSLQLIQELPVQNLKPAVVKIYDYYQPSDQAETQYSYPCPAGESGKGGEL